MFDAPELNQHLKTAYTVKSNARVYAEINLNAPDNIERIGVYRFRPNDVNIAYRYLPKTYDPFDSGDFYTDAELSYEEIGGTFDATPDGSIETIFRQTRDNMSVLYSLEECFRPHRPRSGINKMLYLGHGYFDGGSKNPAARPRFYMADRRDHFKYWTSYKREGTVERGISYKLGNVNAIDDAVPFVVYREPVPANRIAIKMQTKVGEENLGQILSNGSYVNDPFYGEANKQVPKNWTVEVLQNGSWNTAYTFTESTQVPVDGQVELGYGIVVPSQYQDIYTYRGEVTIPSMLPAEHADGDLYLVRTSDAEIGEFWIAIEDQWQTFKPAYGWTVESDGFNNQSRVAVDLVNPKYYRGPEIVFRDFQVIQGIRIVVRTMNTVDTPFELIEISPRLVMDWTDRTESFSVSKILADMSGSSVPVGNLMASTGNIAVSNTDSAFNVNNSFNAATGHGSIIANLQSIRTKISFYDVVMGVNGRDYHVPIKTLYTETSPDINNSYESVTFELRDLYYLFESITAPSLIMTDVSLSRAIMTLMDFVGFTNYTFKRKADQQDPIIPYFFVTPDKNVAEVLVDLAIATQSAIFLDEFNNLVVATKEYLLPEMGERGTDLVLRGSDSDGELANIIEISSADRQVYNSGDITFTKRYIQRSYGSINQAMYHPQDKSWIYVPSLVWEVTGDESTRATNDNVVEQSTYTLSAFPLSRSLPANVPEVQGGVLVNNTINVGESANYVARYNGYVYANGEIIKYDAVEYSVTGVGNVWVRSADEYQNYLLGLPFNGKMYPTGLVRIWAEPYYTRRSDGTVILTSGPVEKHGRGQFGTQVVAHEAGLNQHWSNNANVRGMIQNGEMLFSMREYVNYPTGMIQDKVAGVQRGSLVANTLATQSTRNGIMKNNLSQKFWSEDSVRRMTAAETGTLQSSAFIFAGPTFPATADPRDHVSYVYKPLSSYYTNFGTRCRIIGKIEAGSSRDQNPIGASTYFSVPSTNPESQTNISGGSGGIGMHVNPNTNNGYFFEIAALTKADPSSYQTENIEISADLGKIVSAAVVNNVVTIVVDKSVLKTSPTIAPYESISVGGIGSLTGPNINGVFRVENVLNEGAEIKFVLPIVPYTWLYSFGSVLKNSVDLGTVTSASVDANNVATVTIATPTGVNVGDALSATGFAVSGSIPNINKTGMTVLTVSSDGRTLTFQIPKDTYEFTVDDIASGKILKLTSETTKLSNMWFYKVVSDDNGGRITNYTRTSTYIDVTVDSHRLSNSDFVTINLAGNPDGINGAYQITLINGNTIRLNRGGSDVVRTVQKTVYNTIGLTTPVATPYRLWSGLSSILVDTGQFWGQYRTMAEENTTVYDLGIEYVDSSYGRTFYLYINNKQVATVVDPNPMPKYNNMALFVRGQSKLMFENVYAIGENIANGSIASQVQPGRISEVFGIPGGINESDALRKYSVSGFVQASYLSGITSAGSPQYNMYYDEFGTIMREAAYFSVKYDKAYPALYAKLAPTLNRIKGYVVSGFRADPYGAEFMVFNCLDNLCSLDPSTGNYLRINGITFTQSTTKTITVDDYLQSGTSISTSEFRDGKVLRDPTEYRKRYDDIKISRMKHGRRDFQISSDYIQSDAAAESLMGWIIGKMSVVKKNVGISIFQFPTLQLGDIVSFDYVDDNGDVIVDSDKQFIVYNIEYSKAAGSSGMTIFVTEV